MSIDEGEEFVLPSVTIRFYAIRKNNYFVSHDDLNLSAQPVLIEPINY